MRARYFGVCILCGLLLSWDAMAQQNCPVPPAIQPIPKDQNIFSDAQEVALGDAMAETIALHVNVIQDEQLNAHLREVGNRLVQFLPPTQMQFRFYLVDLPMVNAFSIAGGRVYVARKLVALSRSDDELAGVVAHELGHIVTHQSAIWMTRRFREVLGVTQVGDRKDVFEKFHAFVENAARYPDRKRLDEEKPEIMADQVAVFVMARAGFSPQSFVDFWDRFNELHGRSGGWLSDLFGATTPEQHRLRELVRDTAALPPECVDRLHPQDNAAFKDWQAEVVNYSDTQHQEALAGLVRKKQLTLPIRPEVSNLRFSPDGKYILAQDEGGIHVASRDPFAMLFYIPAPEARPALFSPDSKSVIFSTWGLRVENWDVGKQKRTSAHEVTVRLPCLQTEISPTGGILACLNSEYDLSLIDVISNSVICRRKLFFVPGLGDFLYLLSVLLEDRGADVEFEIPAMMSMEFSPDGRYFLADHGMAHFAYDFTKQGELSIPGSIKNLLSFSFAFLGADRIVGINPGAPDKSPILRFPSGERLDEVRLALGWKLRSATNGSFLFVGSFSGGPLAVIDLATKESKIVLRNNAADIYNDIVVSERINGELSQSARASMQTIATLKLPEASLGLPRAATVSADLQYLAVSSRTRAAVWDVLQNSRLFYVRGFHAATFEGSAVYADFPKFQNTPRQIATMDVINRRIDVRELKDAIAAQVGPFLVVTKPRAKSGISWSNADVDVQDIRSGKVLWTRYFKSELPSVSIHAEDATMLLSWPLSDTGGHDELQQYPVLKSRAEKEDYFCEVVDANSGATLSPLLVKTNKGSLRHLRGTASRNWAVVEAAEDQVITYVLPSGEEKGHYFGQHPIISASGLFALDTGKREITLYDLASTQDEGRQYMFADPVIFKAFSADGKRLLVLTSTQTVYVLDITQPSATL